MQNPDMTHFLFVSRWEVPVSTVVDFFSSIVFSIIKHCFFCFGVGRSKWQLMKSYDFSHLYVDFGYLLVPRPSS